MRRKKILAVKQTIIHHITVKKNFLPAGSSRAALDAPTQEQLTVVNMQRNEKLPTFSFGGQNKKNVS